MSVWVDAARPGTLPAAVSPVVLGTAVADAFIGWRFAAAMVVALAFQIGVNYANDYFDGISGVDTAARVGPRRAVAAGLVPPRQMRLAMALAFSVAVAAGIALAAAAGWVLLLVGLACLLAALGYSGGPKPYASAGLGEVFVFLTFGLAATVGSAYVQDEAIVLASLPAAAAMGMLAAAILVANNLRDVATDREAGKVTLSVRIGESASRVLYAVLMAAGVLLLPLVAWAASAPTALLGLLAAPMAVAPVRAVLGGADGRDLVPALLATARLQLFAALLTSFGLWVDF